MAVLQTGQLGLGEALIPAGRGRNAALERVAALVDWAGFEAALAGLREGGPGRPGYPALVLFRALLLQAWWGLSDRELETALGDRLSFARFVGLGLEDPVPDHTALCRFRNRLVAEGRLEALFAALDRQLEAAGLVLRRGTMLDATLLPAAAREPRPGGTPRDPDARPTSRKGRRGVTYGYKAHVGVDEGSGLVRAVLTTPANVNDTVPADALVRGDERAVWGDAAYHTHARQAALEARGIKPPLARPPKPHQTLLPPRHQRNKPHIARRRAAVETTFATWKRRMGLGAIRYLGLAKAAGQVLLTALAFNLRRAAVLTA